METHLVFAGHGLMRNGKFDPGATGIISKGEHRYVKEDLFPAMRKFLPKNHKVIFFDKYNVLSYGNIVALARQYGATQITEVHYDAASPNATGGHVIIHNSFKPDKIDLALRDAINKMVGVRYSHKGYAGISGRTNLGNCNRTKNAGISYRLIELGFGTSPIDAKVMTQDVETYAKALVEAITGESSKKMPSKTTSKVSKPKQTQTGSTQTKNNKNMSVVDYLKSQGISSSMDNRKKLAAQHGIKNYTGTASQNTKLLNALRGSSSNKTSGSSKAKKSSSKANLSVDGKWGKSTTRALQKSLGTTADGVFSSQPKNAVTQALYGGVTWGSNGSPAARALQRKVGSSADGKLGPGTVRSLQKHLGTPQDGVISRPSSTMVKELQRKLNAGTF